jgi:hypothetical protein
MSDDITEALEGAEAEDRVFVSLRYTTGNQIGGKPQVIAQAAEVTLSGLMEVQAILERGGLVEQGNVVNEATRVVADYILMASQAPMAADARDIVGLLAEHGLLRKGA